MTKRRRGKRGLGLVLLLAAAALGVWLALTRPVDATDLPDHTPKPQSSSAAQAEPLSEALTAAVLSPPVRRSRAEALQYLRGLDATDALLAAALENEAACPDALLISLANNPELAPFAAAYPGGGASGGYTQAELDGAHPLLLQWDPRWGYETYGSGPLALTGCGPTCLAMAALALTGDESATPDRVAAYSERKGYYSKGDGTKWLLFSQGAADFGLRVEELPLWEASMTQALDAGKQIVCCVGGGDFTSDGHFILLYGYSADGFLVNDPNSRLRSAEAWPYDRLSGQISNLWALSREEA